MDSDGYERASVGIKVRKDLLAGMNKLRHAWELNSKRATLEHILEQAISNPPPPPKK